MHLSSKNGSLTRRPARADIVQTLEKMRLALGFDIKAWASRLHLTVSEYESIKTRQRQLPSSRLLLLADEFYLNLNAIVSGNIDYATLAAQFSGNHSFIPEKYKVAAFSKKRTLLNVLDFIETFFGHSKRLAIMRDFQLTEAALADPEAPINIRLITEVFEKMGRMGLSSQIFVAMGSRSIVSNRMNPLKKLLGSSSTPADMYSDIINNYIGFFEQNCSYRLQSLTKKTATVLVNSNSAVTDLLGVKELGNTYVCDFKSGMLSSFPKLLGLPTAYVHESACVHRGDSSCKFELNFEHAHHIASQLEFH